MSGCVVATFVSTSIALSSRQATTLSDLVNSYRTADTDRAVATVASWPPLRLKQETAALPAGADNLVLAARAMLLTESAFQNATWGKPTGTALEPIPDVSQTMSFQYVDSLRRSAQTDPQLAEFVRDWTAYVTSMSMRFYLPLFPDSNPARLRDDAVGEMILGAVYSKAMGPILRDVRNPSPIPPGYLGLFWPSRGQSAKTTMRNQAREITETIHGQFFTGLARDAEVAFKRAVSLSPSLAEASVRLGHLYFLLDRTKDAQRFLEAGVAASELSGDRRSTYVANLILGRIHERAGRLAEAEAAYRAASTVGLPGHSAPLALGTLLVATGRFEEGWQAARLTFADEFAVRPKSVDPWVGFQSFQYGRINELVARLRAFVRPEPKPTAGSAGAVAGVPSAMRPIGVGEVVANPPALPSLSPQTFRTVVQGVRMDVRVVGDDGLPVRDLTARDFIVLDNGWPQEIAIDQGPGRIAAALVVDVSRSSHAIRTEQDAALLKFMTALNPGDVATVLSFSDRIARHAGPVDPSALRRMPAFGLEWWARTTMHDAVMAGASLVAATDGFPVVLVFGDAADNASGLNPTMLGSALGRAGIIVDAVWSEFTRSAASPSDIRFGRMAQDDYAKATGGMVFNAADPALGQRLFDRLTEIRSSYVITYTPNPSTSRDGWHKLSVKLRNRRGTVKVRDGYQSGPTIARR